VTTCNSPSQMDVLQLSSLGNEAQQLGHAIKGRRLDNAHLGNRAHNL